MDEPSNEVFEVDDVGCCFDCGKETNLLAGPGHSPCNAEANWVCRDHLDLDAIVIPLED